MTAPTPNAALAYAVLDHIDAHPEQWNQGVYIGLAECGTVACFAGWTVLLSGDKPDFNHSFACSTSTSWINNGQDVSERAQELLGASRWLVDTTGDMDDERDLFYDSNDREDLGGFVEEIFGPRPDGGEGGNAAVTPC